MKQIVSRLKNPTVLFSVLTQVVALLILMGVRIDEDTAMTAIGMVMAILASLGIFTGSRRSAVKTTALPCAGTGEEELHVLVGGEMVCLNCGAVYIPPVSGGDA